jgi:hypothetical protein
MSRKPKPYVYVETPEQIYEHKTMMIQTASNQGAKDALNGEPLRRDRYYDTEQQSAYAAAHKKAGPP